MDFALTAVVHDFAQALKRVDARHPQAVNVRSLVLSQFTCQKALLVYGFEYPNWPLEPAIAALEALMRAQVSCGPRITATLVDLIHPWEIAVTQ
jgi:hypothetical protein